MQTEIITIYCLCVEYLAAVGYHDDCQVTLTTAEVMTIALVAALTYLCVHIRKRIETTFSSIAEQMPKCIRAVTPRGIELKVCLFLLAFAICG